MERNAWGFSLFCDDIRWEVGGKTSAMGIYLSDMRFETDFPIVVAKFGILVKYFEMPGVFKDDLILRVFSPGDEKDKPSINMEVPRSTMGDGATKFPMEEDQERIITLTMPIILSPLPIKQEGFIKVRMHCGHVITNLGSLWVHKAAPASIENSGVTVSG